MLPLPLPRSWPNAVRNSMQQVVALAQYSFAFTRAVAANSPLERVRLKAENELLKQEVAWLKEELRIKDSRMAMIPAHKRPHYSPQDRMVILLLRAARNWNLTQTAKRFQVTAETIASWTQRATDDASGEFISLRSPVNKFPDFVGEAVRQLKALCPFLGKVKIAEVLSRSGLHLGVITVQRMLKDVSKPMPAPQASEPKQESLSTRPQRKITSKRPNHVWLVDLTSVPVLSGMWATWFPFSLPQIWPFCYWLCVIEDPKSRRVMNVKAYRSPPTSLQVQQLLQISHLRQRPAVLE